MRRFSFTLIPWWFALTAPVRTSMKTLAEREYERKRRLLSVLLFVDLAVSLTAALLESVSLLDMPPVISWIAICVFLFTLWLNRRGYLQLAALICLFCAASLVFTGVQALSLSYPTALLWGLPELMFYLALSGLLLPAWMICLLAVVEHLVLYWYLFMVRYHELMHFISPQEFQSFFIYLILWIYFCACIGATYAITTRRAVAEADRTAEVEQAHHALTEAYADLETAHATIQKQALTDGLTGLPNHRAVVDQLEKELNRARRYHRPFSLLFLDADRFKKINDIHGHDAGDAVLCELGIRATGILRGGDTLGRFGGEEFVLLLPEASAEEAKTVAERIRAAVAARPAALAEAPGGLTITVSVGVATYPEDGTDEQELLHQADQAMYVAKRLGRNQVRTAVEARAMSTDLELMALLQQDEQREAGEREGCTPESLREAYTVKAVCSLMAVLERRDQSMSQHAHTVSDLATAIAQMMELEPVQVYQIGLAALLHDIGKVAIPDRLLQKASLLSDQERELFKEHASLGAQILETSPFLLALMPAVRHHHERWDGQGYPDRLAGQNIPLAARIIGVAEAYDTMQRELPYQTSRSAEEALRELWRCVNSQFDSKVVQALAAVLKAQHEQQVLQLVR